MLMESFQELPKNSTTFKAISLAGTKILSLIEDIHVYICVLVHLKSYPNYFGVKNKQAS